MMFSLSALSALPLGIAIITVHLFYGASVPVFVSHHWAAKALIMVFIVWQLLLVLRLWVNRHANFSAWIDWILLAAFIPLSVFAGGWLQQLLLSQLPMAVFWGPTLTLTLSLGLLSHVGLMLFYAKQPRYSLLLASQLLTVPLVLAAGLFAYPVTNTSAVPTPTLNMLIGLGLTFFMALVVCIQIKSTRKVFAAITVVLAIQSLCVASVGNKSLWVHLLSPVAAINPVLWMLGSGLIASTPLLLSWRYSNKS